MSLDDWPSQEVPVTLYLKRGFGLDPCRLLSILGLLELVLPVTVGMVKAKISLLWVEMQTLI